MMQLFQNANGYKSGMGKITAADNIIQAIQKIRWKSIRKPNSVNH
jgi:hypothetical protein